MTYLRLRVRMCGALLLLSMGWLGTGCTSYDNSSKRSVELATGKKAIRVPTRITKTPVSDWEQSGYIWIPTDEPLPPPTPLARVDGLVEVPLGKALSDPSGIHIACANGHIAFDDSDGTSHRVVRDGKAGAAYSSIDYLVMSADGTRVAYSARKRGESNARVVLDDVEHPAYESISDLVFSSDGKRFAYRASRNNRSFAVVDGKEIPPGEVKNGFYNIVDRSLVFNPRNSAWMYFVAEVDTSTNRRFVRGEHRVDERQITNVPYGPSFAGVNGVVISPDGARTAYVAQSGYESFVYVDGQRQKDYSDIHSLRFSPDSRRLGYVCKRKTTDHGSCVVIDGQERYIPGEGYIWMDVWTLEFSPDSRSVAYVVKAWEPKMALNGIDIEHRTVAYYLVWEGKDASAPGIRTSLDADSHGDLRFSPDSAHIAYVARKNDRMFVAVCGKSEKKSPLYDVILGPPCFLPDGTLVWFGTHGDQLYKVTWKNWQSTPSTVESSAP